MRTAVSVRDALKSKTNGAIMKACNICQKDLPRNFFDMTRYGYKRHVCRSCYKDFLESSLKSTNRGRNKKAVEGI